MRDDDDLAAGRKVTEDAPQHGTTHFVAADVAVDLFDDVETRLEPSALGTRKHRIRNPVKAERTNVCLEAQPPVHPCLSTLELAPTPIVGA